MMKRTISIFLTLALLWVGIPLPTVSADSVVKRPTPALQVKTLPYYSYSTATSMVSHEITYLEDQYRKIRVDIADLTEVRAAQAFIFVNLERKMKDGSFQSVGHFKVLGGDAYHVEFSKETSNRPLVGQASYRIRITANKNLNHKMHGRYAIYQVDPINASTASPSTAPPAVEDSEESVVKEKDSSPVWTIEKIQENVIQNEPAFSPNYEEEANPVPDVDPLPEVQLPEVQQPEMVETETEQPQIDSQTVEEEPEIESESQPAEPTFSNTYELTKEKAEIIDPTSYQVLQAGEVIQIQMEDTSQASELPKDAYLLVQLQRKTKEGWKVTFQLKVPPGKQAFTYIIKREHDENLQNGQSYRVAIKGVQLGEGTMEGSYVVEYRQGEREKVKKTGTNQFFTSKKTPKYQHSYQLLESTDVSNAPFVVSGQPLPTLKQGQVIELKASDTSVHPHLPDNAHIQFELQRRTLLGWKAVGKVLMQKGDTKFHHVFRSETEQELENGQAYRVVVQAKDHGTSPMTGTYEVRFINGERKKMKEEVPDAVSINLEPSIPQKVTRVF